MASTGWGDYLQNIRDGGGNSGWSVNSGNKTANISLDKDSESNELQIYNLSLSIPETAEITGIGFSYDYSRTGATATETVMNFGDVNGSAGKTNVTQAEVLGSSGTVEHDYPVTTWRGSLITPAMVNDPTTGFSLAISVGSSGMGGGEIDLSTFRCKIDYLEYLVIKRWTGTHWVDEVLKYRASTGWVPIERGLVKRWNGTTWIQH